MSFRNLARVTVMPSDDAGVADIDRRRLAAGLRGRAGALTARAARGCARGGGRADGRAARSSSARSSRRSPSCSRGRQVHVPRPPRRAQDADPPGGRAAVRRQGASTCAPCRSRPSRSAAASRPAARARGRRRSCRSRRATRSRSSRAWRATSSNADPQAQADEPRPALRHLSRLRRDHASEPEKSLIEGLKKSGGRNAHGRKTARHRGGGAKRLYRKIDFKRRKDGVPAKVARSSTTRTARPTSRCCTTSTARSATSSRRNGLRVGTTVRVRPERRHRRRQRLPLANMPAGTVVHNVELQPGRGGQLGRSAGTGDPADGEGRRDGDAAPALRRDAHGARRVPRHDRRRSATPTTRTSRSARRAASATWACARRRAARR